MKEIAPVSPFGETDMLVFRNMRERVIYCVLIRLLFALRFGTADCEKAADYAIILWRIWRDDDIINDNHLKCFAKLSVHL